MIPYGRQLIEEDDIAAVVDVLRGDWLTQGPIVEAFEADLAQKTGARFAIAFSNGTAALHAACAAADLGPGDKVATTPLTFAASANAARYVGADVTLVDIDPSTLNIAVPKIPTDIEGLVAVHYAGLPIDLATLAHRPRVVIEDASHAIGAMTPDGPVGCCAHSDMTTFSFHPVKTITTGEGGAVTTNSEALALRLRRFRTHGIERTDGPEPWHYSVIDEGFNYRLTDIQAALGSSQLGKLDRFVARREAIAELYNTELAGLHLQLPPPAPRGFVHGRHLYPIRIADRGRVYAQLAERGIRAQVHYVPLHHHPRFEDIEGTWPEADHAYDQLLSLPMYPSLGIDEQLHVIDSLHAVVA